MVTLFDCCILSNTTRISSSPNPKHSHYSDTKVLITDYILLYFVLIAEDSYATCYMLQAILRHNNQSISFYFTNGSCAIDVVSLVRQSSVIM